MAILDVGSGERSFPDANITVDIRGHPTFIADARQLPFRPKIFDKIYASHLIEHFTSFEIHNLLEEWKRVLKTEGIVEIFAPNNYTHSLLYVLFHWIPYFQRKEYEQNFKRDEAWAPIDWAHKTFFNRGILRMLLEEHGFEVRFGKSRSKWKRILPLEIHAIGRAYPKDQSI